MYGFYLQVVTVNANTLTLVLMICALGCLIMHATLPVPWLAFAAYPFMAASALLSRALLLDTPMVSGLERGPGIALTTGIGMIVALTVIVVLVRLFMLVRDLTGRQPDLLQSTKQPAP